MANDKVAFDYFAHSQYGGNAGGMNNVNVAFCGDSKSGILSGSWGTVEPNNQDSEGRHKAVKHAREMRKHVEELDAKK